ncbi:polysaccharide lyase 6 family protein [Paenibacillus hemerocallicola]|nr:polysaccharide lyase 6 family protein [Paenibacillus hemerocallicola]
MSNLKATVSRIFQGVIVLILLGTVLPYPWSSVARAETIVHVSSAAQLADAIAQATAGDTIVLADGTYAANERIHMLNKHGTATEPIRIMAQNKGKAVISGDLWILIESSSYVTIDGLKFQTNGNAGNKAVYLLHTVNCRVTNSVFSLNESIEAANTVEWLLIEGDQGGYNRVDHNLFENKIQPGQFVTIKGSVTSSVYNRIDHNRFRNMRVIGVNGGEAVKIGNGSHNNWSYAYATLEYNLFENCDGEEAEMVSVKSGGNTIRHNVIAETAGSVVFRRGNGNSAYGNYFLGNGKTNTGGIRLHGEDHKVFNNYFENLAGSSSRSALVVGSGASDGSYDQVKRALVAFNTFVGNTRGLWISLDGNQTGRQLPEDSVIANNVVVASGSSKRLVQEAAATPGVAWEGNVMYADQSAILGASKTSAEINVTDPLLVQGADRLYRLSENSPAIDAAVGAFPSIADDIEGRARDTAPDAGAMEYAVIPPLTAPVLSGLSARALRIGDTLQATSSRDGALYLMPGMTYMTGTVFEAAYGSGWTAPGGTMAAAQAGVAAGLDTEGLTEGIYSLYAVDTAGNISPGIKVLLLSETDFATVVDDTEYAVTVSGAWTELAGGGYFLGTMKRSNESGAYADIPFYGKQAKLYATMASNYGKADIYVDGVYRSTIDYYSASTQAQQMMFDTGLLPEGNHTVRVKVIRQRNDASQGFYATYDVLKVLREDQLSPGLSDVTAGPVSVGAPVTATSTKNGTLFLVPAATPANRFAIETVAAAANGSSVTVTAGVYGMLDTSGFASGTYIVYATDTEGNLSAGSAVIRIVSPDDIDDTDSAVGYSGAWTELAGGNYFLGTVRRANAIGAYADIPFYGSRAKLYASLGSNYGKADIYVDGVYRTTVDGYSPTSIAQQELFDTGVLPEGNHVVRLYVIRQRNEASQGYYVTFDVLKRMNE